MNYGKEQCRNKPEVLEAISAVDQNLQNFGSKVFQYLQDLSTKENYIVKIDCLNTQGCGFFPLCMVAC